MCYTEIEQEVCVTCRRHMAPAMHKFWKTHTTTCPPRSREPDLYSEVDVPPCNSCTMKQPQSGGSADSSLKVRHHEWPSLGEAARGSLPKGYQPYKAWTGIKSENSARGRRELNAGLEFDPKQKHILPGLPNPTPPRGLSPERLSIMSVIEAELEKARLSSPVPRRRREHLRSKRILDVNDPLASLVQQTPRNLVDTIKKESPHESSTSSLSEGRHSASRSPGPKKRRDQLRREAEATADAEWLQRMKDRVATLADFVVQQATEHNHDHQRALDKRRSERYRDHSPDSSRSGSSGILVIRDVDLVGEAFREEEARQAQVEEQSARRGESEQRRSEAARRKPPHNKPGRRRR